MFTCKSGNLADGFIYQYERINNMKGLKALRAGFLSTALGYLLIGLGAYVVWKDRSSLLFAGIGFVLLVLIIIFDIVMKIRKGLAERRGQRNQGP